MKLHANAALSLNQRRRLVARVVEEGWTLTRAAAAAEVSVRCARKWVGRYRADGDLGLIDRSSAPVTVANRTDHQRIEAIAALRRLRFTAPEIAEVLDMALSTVSGILTRLGLGRLGRLGLEPAERYERARPGELIHIDVKSSAASCFPGIGSPATAASERPAPPTPPTGTASATPAGSSSTSPSMTARGWPTPRFSTMRRRPPRSRSCAAPSRSSSATASPSSASSPTDESQVVWTVGSCFARVATGAGD
jgi:transposase